MKHNPVWTAILAALLPLSGASLAQAAVVSYSPSTTVNYAMSIRSDDVADVVSYPLLAGLADDFSTASVYAAFNGTPGASGFSATLEMSGTANRSFFSTAAVVPLSSSVPFQPALYEFTVDAPTEIALTISGSSFSINGQINFFEYHYGLYRGIPGSVDNIIVSQLSNSGIMDASHEYLLDAANYFVVARIYQTISSPSALPGQEFVEASYSHSFTVSLDIGPTTVVPLPAAGWLFGPGLLGLVGYSRRRGVRTQPRARPPASPAA